MRVEGGSGLVGVAYDHGVEARAVESSWCAFEVLGGLELGFKVGLQLGRAVGEEGAVVEALVDGSGGGEGG